MRKTLAMLLALAMLLVAIPMCASAEDDVVTITAMWEGTRPQNEFTDETWQYINFQPHLLPQVRGIEVTIYATCDKDFTNEEVYELYKDF